jgi:hypothetical protein
VSYEGLPLLLTVEEASELLRIGRTKAYAMAREWRETEGRSGLPVIDLGNVLRVPRRALEDMLGAELPDVTRPQPADKASQTSASVEPPQSPTNAPNVPTDTPPVRRTQTTGRSRRRRKAIANQLDLFDAEPAAS